ncbi:hypothetical protein BGZ80_003982 [Entomortierella chlamydospora]|uniref:Uncharacterized protein n=1 Tax=Entomortierella chlamydospora TaxID=101097 RepID=A0A9P6N1V2_9FUNG|nr:hypothetical protein BGZ80_003982 [Entomortierella chlamydospora]
MSSPFLRTAVTANRTIMRAAGRPSSKKGGSTSLNGDARNDLIKKVLFDAPPRPPVRMTPEELTRHETIERAWKLVRQQRKQEQEKDLARKTLTDTPPKQIWNYRQASNPTSSKA